MDDIRIWSGKDGRYQVEASYVCLFQDKKVKLRKLNGTLIAVPLNILCKEDIAFVSMQQSQLAQIDSTSNSLIDDFSSIVISNVFSSHSSWNDSTPSLFSSQSSQISSCRISQATDVSYEPLQEVTLGIQPNVRPLSPDESNMMLPKRSLSSIVQQLSTRHQQLADPPNLIELPNKIKTNILAFLDVHSRLTLLAVTRRIQSIVLKPVVWRDIYFLKNKNEKVDDYFFHHLIRFLQRHQLEKYITNVFIDHTNITAKTIVQIIKNFRNIHTLSLQSCWKVHSYTLAVGFKNMSYSNHHFSRISQFIIGKQTFQRGITTSEVLESKSLSQDISFINSALDRLARKNVHFDAQMC